MKLSEKIIQLRKVNSWSQEDLAEKMEVSRQAISRWENATALPDSNNLLQLSKLFNVTADYLLNEDYTSDNDIPCLKEASEALDEKKKDYVQHFKDVADILRDAGLQDTSDFYKIHLFRYLNWDKNNSDSELFEIYDDVFGMDYEAFDKTDFNYTKFNIATKFYFAIKNDSEEFYRKVNKEFLTINIYDTIALSEDILDKYLLTVYSYSVDDLKSNYNLYLMNNVEFMKEFSYFKIEKMIFNLDIQKTETVFRNAKMVISRIPIWEIEKLSKRTIKKCYRVLSYDSVHDY